MSFVSHAQQFEDVMLWRALRHVERGCYVDIGAQHPVIDSVSLAFYERGWRGVHVEPVPEYAALLRQQRPDETVIEAALTDTDGVAEFNVIPETGLSTLVVAHAHRHASEGKTTARRIHVPTLTLRTALQPLAGKAVHWLKIDVEGAEAAVLAGWDSAALRPWIMLIEATLPGMATSHHHDWEPVLLEAGYRFAWFDGLNRYYVAAEHAELLAAFASPPNVFDDIRLTVHSALCGDLVAAHQLRLDALVDQAIAAEARAAAAETRAAAATLRATQAESQLRAMLASHSWRLTAPLRRLVDLLRRWRHRRGADASPPPDAAQADQLSPRARRIHDRLAQAIAAQQSHAHTD